MSHYTVVIFWFRVKRFHYIDYGVLCKGILMELKDATLAAAPLNMADDNHKSLLEWSVIYCINFCCTSLSYIPYCILRIMQFWGFLVKHT